MLDLKFLDHPSIVGPRDETLDNEDSADYGDLSKQMSCPKFALPALTQPLQWLQHQMSSTAEHRIKMAKGTTTLAFKFNEGIIVAVDSRASGGTTIMSQTVKKVIEINPYLLGTLAGGAADCQYWERELSRRCRVHELRNKERISVAAASKLLCNMAYAYKGAGLSMGTMIIGWDKKGPQIYYVDSDGQRLYSEMFSVGSGSTYAYGVLDSGFRPDLTVQEAIELGQRSIYHATHRDAASGGVVNVYHIKPGGWEFISQTDVNELHYKFADEPKPALI